MLKSRKRSLLITIIDFVIIFFVIFLINSYLLSIKTITYKDFKLKYKYDKLKENLGYIFTLSIKNNSDKKRILPIDNKVNFYIENKETKKNFWQKNIQKPSFPLNALIANCFLNINKVPEIPIY